MRIRSVLLPAIAIVMLCSASVTHGATRARSLAEATINDAPHRIAAGEHHTCQIKEDGRVRCWGFNFSGQLGDGTTTPTVAPVTVSGVSGAVALSAGSFFTCALLVDSTVRCWGDNGAGQLGGTPTTPFTPVAVSGLSNVVALAAGAQHACALLANGPIRCWGANGAGQLGDGTTTSQPTPVAASGAPGVVALAAGSSHTCALLVNGTARCWGSNSSGQLGDGTLVPRLVPVAVSGLSGAVAITARNLHTCALLGSGVARCWGSNASGELGDGSTTRRLTPVAVSGLTNAVGLTAGTLHTCAVTASGAAGCWGSNSSGQLGDGSGTGRLKPVTVSPLANAVAVAAGTEHSCAVLADGSARCWGAHLFAQLGNGTAASGVFSPRPSIVAGGGGSVMARGVATGFFHSCVLRANGTVSCWGDNRSGKLGDGTETPRLSPVAVAGISNAVAVATGEEHTCAILANGTVRCWGQNINGQLGDNSAERFRFTPVTVSGLTSAVAITAGRFHSCALLANGTVRCWGTNVNGSLGDGTRTARRVPVPVVGLSNAVAIVAGGEHTCALLADGSVRCWGDNSAGVLGDGSTIAIRLTPVAVSGLVDAVAIATGSNHSCAARVDGGVSCWGSNFLGQLGTGDATGMDQRTPIRITVFNAVAISAGNGHTCALLAGGGAQCWGLNDSGGLGDGTTTLRLFPTTVTGQTGPIVTSYGGATRIAAGYLHTCAIQASGSLHCWGENGNGQLGDGSTTDRLRPPAQISSFVISSISSVSSISLNIDPQVTLEDDVREATVTVLAACEEGQEVHVDVVLTQGAVSGRASSVEPCVGGLGRHPIVVSAPSGAAFRGGAATVQADAQIVSSGEIIDTQSWTRAVQVLGTDGSLEGSASGIGTGTDNGSLRLTGQFTAEDSISLDQATLTVTALLLEAGGAGELVHAAGGAPLLPLTLVARAGATSAAAIYQTESGVRPAVRAEVKSRDADTGFMEYSLTVDRATIPAPPAGCSSAATTNLRTRFSLAVGGETLDLDLTVPWRCLGNQLRTP